MQLCRFYWQMPVLERKCKNMLLIFWNAGTIRFVEGLTLLEPFLADRVLSQNRGQRCGLRQGPIT